MFFLFLFSEEKSLRDDEILQSLPVGTSATIYFRDLGPQLGWTMVRKVHTHEILMEPERKKNNCLTWLMLLCNPCWSF